MSTADSGPGDAESKPQPVANVEPAGDPEPTARAGFVGNQEPTAGARSVGNQEPTAGAGFGGEPDAKAGFVGNREPMSNRERTAGEERPTGIGRRWLQRLVTIAIAILIGVLAYFVVAAFIPRWWAQRIAHQVDSKFTLGVVWGLFYGGLFTFVAVLVALQARRPMFRWPLKVGLIVVALLLEIPNLMTLGIVIGTSAAAHAGQRILDVEAPAFRSATVAGVIIGALLALGVFILVTLVRQRGRQVKALQAQIKRQAAESRAVDSKAPGDRAPAAPETRNETAAG